MYCSLMMFESVSCVFFLDAVQLVYLLVNVDEQQHEEQRQDADQDQVVLQLGFGLGLLGLVDRVDDRIEL